MGEFACPPQPCRDGEMELRRHYAASSVLHRRGCSPWQENNHQQLGKPEQTKRKSPRSLVRGTSCQTGGSKAKENPVRRREAPNTCVLQQGAVMSVISVVQQAQSVARLSNAFECGNASEPQRSGTQVHLNMETFALDHRHELCCSGLLDASADLPHVCVNR